jgi:hypothetical protein
MPKKTIAEAITPIVTSLMIWIAVGFVLPLNLLAYSVISPEVFLGWLVAFFIVLFGLLVFWTTKLGPSVLERELVAIKGKQLTMLVEVIVGVFAIGGTLIALSLYLSPAYTVSSCLKPAGVNVTSPNCQQVKTVSVPNSGPSGIGEIGFWIVQLGLDGVWVFISVYFTVMLLQRISGRLTKHSR